jgi:hypothetical protein
LSVEAGSRRYECSTWNTLQHAQNMPCCNPMILLGNMAAWLGRCLGC